MKKLSFLILFAVILAACTPAAMPTPAPAPTATMTPATAIPPSATPIPPTATPIPSTATPIPPTATPAPPMATSVPPTATASPTAAKPDAALGEKLWAQAPCVRCHGPAAEGKRGPKLAGTGLTFDQVLLQVRRGGDPMPAFTADEISDQDLRHIYAWLRSLTPQAQPTPIARPSYPTAALLAMWQHVNDMKVKSDFAKDLPERQAADDAGRLTLLKQYAGEAIGEGQAALAQANQALNEIPAENVKAVIRQTIDATNAVIDQANQARGQGSFAAAWPKAAEMVRLSRLDAWPFATQAVRDAGLAGTVRVSVTDQAGRAIPGAFVTVLTAHTPVGVRTDSAGRATIPNVAAVPALQVKAYAAGLVYHEVHVNLAPGGAADAAIALPGPSAGGQTPAVANAAITPASGAGNATVTLSVTATDPQGALNLAEDQVFALNPTLGLAYVLRNAGGDRYQLQVALPGLAQGAHTWYFFVVDHQCNTSNVLEVKYTVQ
ncbi:MAG: c-type cytochrome [Chloroflexi bacterium]|nr:c-type cytochrome [Chloroflexota bacterium]